MSQDLSGLPPLLLNFPKQSIQLQFQVFLENLKQLVGNSDK